MPDRALLEGLHRVGAVQRGEFVLASGARSSVYLDLRRTVSHPHLLRRMASLLGQRLAGHGCRAIAGVPLAGLPLAAAVALERDWPMVYPRPAAKDHGLRRKIEGDLPTEVPLWLVDDVATSGGSLLDAVSALEGAGYRIAGCAVVADRQEGAAEALRARDLKLLSLFTLADCLQTAVP